MKYLKRQFFFLYGTLVVLIEFVLLIHDILVTLTLFHSLSGIKQLKQKVIVYQYWHIR